MHYQTSYGLILKNNLMLLPGVVQKKQITEYHLIQVGYDHLFTFRQVSLAIPPPRATTVTLGRKSGQCTGALLDVLDHPDIAIGYADLHAVTHSDQICVATFLLEAATHPADEVTLIRVNGEEPALRLDD